jgi:hypothetical protein
MIFVKRHNNDKPNATLVLIISSAHEKFLSWSQWFSYTAGPSL